mmetsp:Transcript_29222/g.74536  ORF Transcript_29222/g.74536 Transcript_29222/m.74536 type:complete len:151 (+) Transcript_29222:316-768(+)
MHVLSSAAAAPYRNTLQRPAACDAAFQSHTLPTMLKGMQPDFQGQHRIKPRRCPGRDTQTPQTGAADIDPLNSPQPPSFHLMHQPGNLHPPINSSWLHRPRLTRQQQHLQAAATANTRALQLDKSSSVHCTHTRCAHYPAHHATANWPEQ